jgi:hypothetical protein
MKNKITVGAVVLGGSLTLSATGFADEGLFGYVKGAEPLPKGSMDVEQWFTVRSDKGQGHYDALDTKTEVEWGITDKFATAVELYGLGINTSGLMIDAYLPKDEKYTWKPAGLEVALKYNFLSPAKDWIGLSQYVAFSYFCEDVNSGQRKDVYSVEGLLLAQKYFMDGQVVLAGNLGIEATSATRKPIDGLPPDFEWPTTPEMEIEVTASAGITYRFAENWFIGGEIFYQTEHETVVGQERWSIQAGPTLHYGGQKWWATLTWLPQIRGGGLMYPGQTDTDLHLIEKTKQEVRLKIGFNF